MQRAVELDLIYHPSFNGAVLADGILGDEDEEKTRREINDSLVGHDSELWLAGQTG